jgi:hypothetical protein
MLKEDSMNQFLTIIILSFVLHACVMDTVYNCQIKNNTAQPIKISISFDKSFLDSIYNGQKNKYLSFLKEHIGQDSGISMNHFDTLNVIANYTISPKLIFTLEHGMSGPTYDLYKTITIIGKDKMVLHNKKEMAVAFKELSGNYILTIE